MKQILFKQITELQTPCYSTTKPSDPFTPLPTYPPHLLNHPRTPLLTRCLARLQLYKVNYCLQLFDWRVGKRLLRRLPSGPIVFKHLSQKETSQAPH